MEVSYQEDNMERTTTLTAGSGDPDAGPAKNAEQRGAGRPHAHTDPRNRSCMRGEELKQLEQGPSLNGTTLKNGALSCLF